MASGCRKHAAMLCPAVTESASRAAVDHLVARFPGDEAVAAALEEAWLIGMRDGMDVAKGAFEALGITRVGLEFVDATAPIAGDR